MAVHDCLRDVDQLAAVVLRVASQHLEGAVSVECVPRHQDSFRNLHLVTSHAYNEYGFAWSPDGRNILYGRANREGIYVSGANGRNNHRLTRDSPRPVEWGALTWASDGRSIAYATDRTGNGDIYVIDADGHNKVRLTSSAASDIDPSWQPQ